MFLFVCFCFVFLFFFGFFCFFLKEGGRGGRRCVCKWKKSMPLVNVSHVSTLIEVAIIICICCMTGKTMCWIWITTWQHDHKPSCTLGSFVYHVFVIFSWAWDVIIPVIIISRVKITYHVFISHNTFEVQVSHNYLMHSVQGWKK